VVQAPIMGTASIVQAFMFTELQDLAGHAVERGVETDRERREPLKVQDCVHGPPG
jgi:hypothetical protein